ncbi:hypothetical protein BD324DRAFT_636693 [Kockovaella imperatae]|uniref:Uncharacterized protein n=1 Tax=Kockovaella imperatae TaxID=4999 RepID=A0A1Y1U7W1_9TREE|nr:hypothetical protein BD324DRAFT_636693 [Kockovaella imperatae]ORX34121.1 hypothetical protein BD324DRAFT_636693 [Kockovaella imperatae]
MASSSSSMPSGPCCQRCYRENRSVVPLEEDYDTRELVCSSCGLVDQARSGARNLVGESNAGATVFEDHDMLTTWKGEWNANSSLNERRFKYTLAGLLDTYLVDARTCILEQPDPDLKRHATTIFEQIRRAEQRKRNVSASSRGDPRYFHATTNPHSRVFPFQVVVAIKLAAQLRTLAWINTRLERETQWEQGIAKTPHGSVPVVPPLWELYKATHRLPNVSAGRLDDYYYLDRTLRSSCQLIRCPLSRTDDMLCLFLQAIRRFKTLASFSSHQDRLPHLLSKPLSGESKTSAIREWRVSDWAYFDDVEIDWEKVLEVGYNLYQAQQCVSLWDHTAAAQCAVALCFVATSGVLREVIPQQINILRELSLEFGLNDQTTNERFRDLKKFVISWSNSLKDAGIPFPQVNPPRVGGLGDGFKNYASDLRRGIPEQEILCAVTVDVATHWRDILQARLNTRQAAKTFAEELRDARSQAAAAGMRLEPILMSRRWKEENEKNTSMQFASAMLHSTDPKVDRADANAASQSRRSPPPTPPLHRPVDLKDTSRIDTLLQEQDDNSSDGGKSEVSTDDEGAPSRQRRSIEPSPGLNLHGLGEDSQPFAFTIGPDGFSRAQDDSANRITTPASMSSAGKPLAGVAGTSELSAASQGMERLPSISTRVSAGPDNNSASETEQTVSRSYKSNHAEYSRASSVAASDTSKHSAPMSVSGSSFALPITPGLSATPLREMSSAPSEAGSGSFHRAKSLALSDVGDFTDPDSHVGILERERDFYMTNRKVSKAGAKARRDQAKADRMATGWIPKPFGGGRKRKTAGSSTEEGVESGASADGPGSGTGSGPGSGPGSGLKAGKRHKPPVERILARMAKSADAAVAVDIVESQARDDLPPVLARAES